MLKVGITGGIGSGKSLVCSVFKKLGIPVYEADIEAKKLYDSDLELKKQMIDLFGGKLYEKGILDRKMLASIIFNDKAKLAQVTKLVHPAVVRNFNYWITQQYGIPYVLHEAAILLESGLGYLVDKIINVSAPEEIRIQRVCGRDNITVEEVKSRIANQFSDEQRNKLSQFIINNDEVSPLLPQILSIHNQLIFNL